MRALVKKKMGEKERQEKEHKCHPSAGESLSEDHEFKASLGYLYAIASAIAVEPRSRTLSQKLQH